MTISIRNATEGDVPAIFEVRTSVRENHLSMEQMAGMGITHEAIRQVVRTEQCTWVAVDGEAVVGFSMVNAAEACLFAAFVRPEWQGQGIGRLLMESAETFLFASHSSIWLHTDPRSRASGFYERLGWMRGPDRRNEDTRFEKHRPM